MGAQTADAIFDYIVEIDDEVAERFGTDYYKNVTEEYPKRVYQVLAEAEQESPKLDYADDDDELIKAIDLLNEENFHTNAVVLIAYMHRVYGWDAIDIEPYVEQYPSLFEDED